MGRTANMEFDMDCYNMKITLGLKNTEVANKLQKKFKRNVYAETIKRAVYRYRKHISGEYDYSVREYTSASTKQDSVDNVIDNVISESNSGIDETIALTGKTIKNYIPISDRLRLIYSILTGKAIRANLDQMIEQIQHELIQEYIKIGSNPLEILGIVPHAIIEPSIDENFKDFLRKKK